MKKPAAWSNAILLAIISVAVAHAQAQRGPPVPQMRGDGPPPEAKPFSITRTDPALDDIISPDAKLVELGRGFGLTRRRALDRGGQQRLLDLRRPARQRAL